MAAIPLEGVRVLWRTGPRARATAIWAVVVALAVSGLYPISRANYPLFHTMVESLSLLLAALICVLGTRTYRYSGNSFLLFLGNAYLFVGALDFLHMVTHNGVEILPGHGPDATVQLWVAAGYLEALSVLVAPFFLRRSFRHSFVLGIYTAATAGLLFSILGSPLFPAPFFEDGRLTPFGAASEYVIALVTAAALLHLRSRREDLMPGAYRVMALAMVASVLARTVLALWIDVYGLASLIGHLLGLASRYCIYLAVVVGGVQAPYLEIRRLNEELERRVSERTAQLEDANRDLRSQVVARRQLEERLIRAQRLRAAGLVAAQVAHDFNNLLSPMVGYPELIKLQLPPGHPAVRYCDAMLDAAGQMAALNENMMVLGGGACEAMRPVRVNRLVELAVAAIPAKPDTVAVDLRLGGGTPLIVGAQGLLVRALSNLLREARGGMGEPGNLTLKAERVRADQPVAQGGRIAPEEYVRFTIAGGRQIAPEVIEKLREGFIATSFESGRRGGSLGISVAQAIVENHQGSLDLESRPGAGTVFVVHLPLICAERLGPGTRS